MRTPSKTRKSKSTSRKIKLFLSYTSRDEYQKNFIHDIANSRLLRDTVELTIDEKSFLPGDNWKRKFNAIINEERAIVLFFFSPEYLTSDSCMYEFKEACAMLYSKGVPLIPVKLKECSIPAPLDDDTVYINMTGLFKTYKSKPGNLADDKTSKKQISVLIRRILEKVGEYENSIYVSRISQPNDKLFEESRKLFESYPADLRDEFSNIKQWIGECGNWEISEFLHEFYYIAYLKKEPIGILYGSHYLEKETRRGFCFITLLIVSNSIAKKDQKLVVARLLEQLFSDTEKYDKRNPRYLFEMPILGDTRKPLWDHILRGWENIPDNCALDYFHGIEYRSPEISDYLEHRTNADPGDMHLFGLNLSVSQNIIPSGIFKSDILNPLYDVFLSEAYLNPWFIREWLSLLDEIKLKISEDLQKNVRIERVKPRNLREKLGEFEKIRYAKKGRKV